jgi:hypothetical protein
LAALRRWRSPLSDRAGWHHIQARQEMRCERVLRPRRGGNAAAVRPRIAGSECDRFPEQHCKRVPTEALRWHREVSGYRAPPGQRAADAGSSSSSKRGQRAARNTGAATRRLARTASRGPGRSNRSSAKNSRGSAPQRRSSQALSAQGSAAPLL